MYIEGWRNKIERNGRLNYSQAASERVSYDPLVSVILRADGSVESVAILRSSGSQQLDNAVRRIIQLNAPFAPFPPGLAAKFDEIEIRRAWQFAGGLRLLEEPE